MIDLRSGVPGVNAPDPTTYEEFWPCYVSQQDWSEHPHEGPPGQQVKDW